jgi:hypothetical protein
VDLARHRRVAIKKKELAELKEMEERVRGEEKRPR